MAGADDTVRRAADAYQYLPDGYPAHIADAFARFGDRYDEICAELFDDDPVLGTDPPAELLDRGPGLTDPLVPRVPQDP